MKLKKRIEYIKFLDHSMGPISDRGSISCEIAGFFLEEDELTVTLMPWLCNGEADNQNNEVIVVVKACIVKRKRLK